MYKGLKASLITLLFVSLGIAASAQEGVRKFVRFEFEGRTAYGEVRGDIVHELDGDLFANPHETGKQIPLDKVKLLAPCEPSKVVAVGLSYRSHLGGREAAAYPGLFAKYPTSIIGPDEPIVLPPDARNAHYEGELVVVIGKTVRRVSKEEAAAAIFGATCGNDVSERTWQAQDLQWFRAKASDTFGPMGPMIVQGLNYDNLLLRTRLNGEVRQEERTSDLIWDVATLVSYISQYVTLLPGDVIFTGTPGITRAMKNGDVVEVEIEGIGVLRNPVRQESR